VFGDTVSELENIEKYREAGIIARKIKKEILDSLVTPGRKLVKIANKIESIIKDSGGKIAFPVNICIDSVAAHYTPLINEETVVPADKIIKVDFGIHIDGYPVDNAVSFYFGDDEDLKEMILTAKEAVNLAITEFKPGRVLSEIGSIIEDFVKEKGYKVIENLNGHLLTQYELHGEKEVPVSSKIKSPGKIEKGEVYAIEVFVTKGAGWAKSSDDIRIYSALSKLPKRLPIHVRSARNLLNFIVREFKTFPFTVRWLSGKFSDAEIRVGIATLSSMGILIPYPVLVEKENMAVAQYEETILVSDEGAEVLT